MRKLITDEHRGESCAQFYQRQIKEAERLLKEKGLTALYNPHGMTGIICGCHNCFCCAALEVYREALKEQSK